MEQNRHDAFEDETVEALINQVSRAAAAFERFGRELYMLADRVGHSPRSYADAVTEVTRTLPVIMQDANLDGVIETAGKADRHRALAELIRAHEGSKQ